MGERKGGAATWMVGPLVFFLRISSFFFPPLLRPFDFVLTPSVLARSVTSSSASPKVPALPPPPYRLHWVSPFRTPHLAHKVFFSRRTAAEPGEERGIDGNPSRQQPPPPG